MTVVSMLIAAYLLGSIPFGLLLTRAAGFGDIRRVGSGNIGATNVLRTGNKALAASVLLAAWLAGRAWAPVAGLAAVAGHCFPVWLRFRGGKGVATGLGMGFGIAWPAGLGIVAVWLLGAAITRISSAAALLACMAAPVLVWATAGQLAAGMMLAAALLIVSRHGANIARLRDGTEPRIGAGR